MIVKLSTGKELTLEEVKEVIDKFQDLLGENKKEYIPYYIERKVYQPYPIYEYPVITCGVIENG